MKSVAFAVIASLLAPSMSFAAQTPVNDSWSTVRKWKPGAEVTVQTRSSESRRRYFISVDDEGVTLLNLSSVGLSSGVARALRQAASESPDHFAMADGVTFKLDEHASLSKAGLFVASQKIAEYDEVVERIVRKDVEAGTVVLDVKKGMPVGKQLLITLGVIVVSPIVIYAIACAAKRCD